jgi:hypothetical protein
MKDRFGPHARWRVFRSASAVVADSSYADRSLRPGISAVERAPAWPDVPAVVPRSHARAAALGLPGLVLAAIVARALLARWIVTPWILPDEFIYSELAKSFAAHGRLLVSGAPYGGFGRVYPTLIAPAWFLWHSMSTTYGVAKTLNAVYMSLGAVPVYLWARRLVSPALALVTVALVLALPAYVYTGTIMTENVSFPTFVLATFAIALALERPTLWTQAFALGAAVLASAVRVQAAVLFAVIVLATALKVLLDLRVAPGRPWTLLRRYLPLLAGLAALGLVYGTMKLLAGQSLTSGLGAYSVVVGGGYPWGEVWRWVLYHFAELSLAVAVVPLAALGVLSGLAAVRGLPGAAERAFVAVAVSTVVLVALQVGLFASRFALRIEERNMIYVMPILLLAFIVWIGRGLPRPTMIASLAAAASAAPLLAIPLSRFLNQTTLSDTFGLVPLLRLATHLSNDFSQVRWIMLFAALDAVLAFLFLPRRIAAVWLPLLLAGYFAYVSGVVIDQTSALASNLKETVPGNASWIDTRIGTGRNAVYLYGADPFPNREPVRLWELEFWNRSLDRVYDLGAATPPGLPVYAARIGPNGRLRSGPTRLLTNRYMVTNRALPLAGRVLATNGDVALYAARRPLTLASVIVEGVDTDRWMGASATYDRYATPHARGGTMVVTLSRSAWGGPDDKPGHATIEVGPLGGSGLGPSAMTAVTDRRTWTIHALQEKRFRLEAPRPPFQVRIRIEPTFRPADYGFRDTRQLGAQVSFAFRPR